VLGLRTAVEEKKSAADSLEVGCAYFLKEQLHEMIISFGSLLSVSELMILYMF
jgi:hypothetical protein